MRKYNLQLSPSDVLAKTASKFRLVRRASKLSQLNLAERSSVSLGSIRRFESTGQVSMESFLKLLHILDRLEEFDNLLLQIDDTERIEKLFSRKTRRS
jgi:transcriptional regulator with XRE-family HTH domain